MCKLRKIILVALLMFITLQFHSTTVSADSENMNFSISVTPPANQFKKDVTYFDMMVKPSEKQKLEVNVSNTGKTEKKIRVTPTNAITNANGLVDYSKQKKDYKYDESLKIQFTSLVSNPQSITVKPGKTETLIFDFEAPAESFDGIILGGFVADLDDEGKTEKKEENISFVNKFQLVKAVVLRSSEKEVEPVLKINDVKPALVTYRTAVVANLQNTTPILLGKVNVDAQITKKGSTDVLKSEKRDNVEFAPNSNFNFPIMWDNTPLEAGKYTLKMTVTANKKDFKFEEDFTISKEDSYNINNKAVDLKEEPKDNTLWYVLSGAFVLIILILVFVIVREKTKKKKKKKSSSSKKSSSKKKSGSKKKKK
ncbi:DUF916 and DUF3324 domain-containing protein [Vagococcus hydrophili]|uniref:DUF916 and DUF3324 domain-containing protein n=1 Tax=Vagococcus hydrophili TaxID=2714947 RepID=A0A6G8ATC7_9ENTE|nr:DUF916 and DUF3324 domain-containing protein [Vagococcus hydrophili]QIL48230.1 DUF916 and DUF3324 domain-containing protein [Vagococcus hydrophili]